MSDARPDPGEMRAAVYRSKRELSVENRDVPEPGASEVLLRISHCGICGTDLQLVMDGWGRRSIFVVGEGLTSQAMVTDPTLRQ